jgi:hypothetical protein
LRTPEAGEAASVPSRTGPAAAGASNLPSEEGEDHDGHARAHGRGLALGRKVRKEEVVRSRNRGEDHRSFLLLLHQRRHREEGGSSTQQEGEEEGRSDLLVRGRDRRGKKEADREGDEKKAEEEEGSGNDRGSCFETGKDENRGGSDRERWIGRTTARKRRREE